jgi:hypothetical protein
VITKGIGRPRSEAIRHAAILSEPKPIRTRSKTSERSATLRERGNGLAVASGLRAAASGSKDESLP